MEKQYRLNSADLVNKWGFSDGDIFSDYTCDLCLDRDRFLAFVVRNKLLPEMDKQGRTYDVYEIGSNHNPIRSHHLCGIEYNHYQASSKPDSSVDVWLNSDDLEELRFNFLLYQN